MVSNHVPPSKLVLKFFLIIVLGLYVKKPLSVMVYEFNGLQARIEIVKIPDNFRMRDLDGIRVLPEFDINYYDFV